MLSNRLSRQISKATKKVSRLAKMYNAAGFSSGVFPANVVEIISDQVIFETNVQY